MKNYRVLPLIISLCLLAFAAVADAQTSSPARPKPTPTPKTDDYFNLSLDDVNRFRAAEIVKKAGKLIDNKEYDAAIKELTGAIALDPRSADAYQQRGIAYEKKGDADKALADLTRSIEYGPKDNYTYFLRGSLYHYSIKNDDLAIKDLTEAIRLEPDSGPNFFTRGQALSAVKRYDAAIADYTSALKIDPKNEYTYYFRGNAYAATGRNSLASADYRGALAIAPGNDSFKRALAGLEKPVDTPKPPVAKRADVLFADLLEKYGDVMDNKYKPKDAEYNDAKKQALAQKAAIAAGKAKGPLDTSNVCGILGELRLIDGDMFDYYDLLDEMYSNGDIKDYVDLKLRFQDYQELQEMIDDDLKNEPALWGCAANGGKAATPTPIQMLAKSAAAKLEIDDLLAKFDQNLASLRKGLAASDANVGLQRTVNCGYYNQTKDILIKIQKRLNQMRSDGVPVYENGRLEYNKRIEQRKALPVLQNCTFYV
jgi:tetratricopeptide (TPR) repeat protein